MEGTKPGDDGLKGIAEMAPPENYTEAQRFLGATGFFRHFFKAVLLKKLPDGKFHPMAYASQELKAGESEYDSLKLEFLALKWAVTN